MTTKATILSIIFLNWFVLSEAQQIRIDTIPFKTYKSIGPSNSGLIDRNPFPANFRSATGIVQYASKRSLIDTHKVVLKTKNGWIQKHNVNDEGETFVKYGLWISLVFPT